MYSDPQICICTKSRLDFLKVINCGHIGRLLNVGYKHLVALNDFHFCHPGHNAFLDFLCSSTCLTLVSLFGWFCDCISGYTFLSNMCFCTWLLEKSWADIVFLLHSETCCDSLKPPTFFVHFCLLKHPCLWSCEKTQLFISHALKRAGWRSFLKHAALNGRKFDECVGSWYYYSHRCFLFIIILLHSLTPAACYSLGVSRTVKTPLLLVTQDWGRKVKQVLRWCVYHTPFRNMHFSMSSLKHLTLTLSMVSDESLRWLGCLRTCDNHLWHCYELLNLK